MVGLSSDEISGPSLGSGAESLAWEGLRPVGGWTTGCGAGIAGGAAGGSMFASGAPQGVALAVGAGPTTRTNPTAAADAIVSDTLRRIADMKHLSSDRTPRGGLQFAHVTIVI
ncbi:hypothetical protein A5700_15440 [Mycobacterium sp. E1214]|nr:hypothetical protein A5700_15440 [Mycobacterium sp. E1214]